MVNIAEQSVVEKEKKRGRKKVPETEGNEIEISIIVSVDTMYFEIVKSVPQRREEKRKTMMLT